MITVNEESSSYATFEFFDTAGDPEVPQSITYRIDDVASGAQIKDDTTVTPASSITITVTSSENAIINSGRKLELKRITLIASYGATEQAVEILTWQVKNLKKV